MKSKKIVKDCVNYFVNIFDSEEDQMQLLPEIKDFLLIYQSDGKITSSEVEFLQKLIEKGAKYIMFVGKNAKKNEFLLVDILLRKGMKNYNPTENFILTSQHENESIKEIIDFALHSAMAETRKGKLVNFKDIVIFVPKDGDHFINFLKEIDSVDMTNRLSDLVQFYNNETQ